MRNRLGRSKAHGFGIEGKASGKGFGRESRSDVDEMIRKVHESAGTQKKGEATETRTKAVDEPPARNIESVEETETPDPTDETIAVPQSYINGLIDHRVAEARTEEAKKIDAAKQETETVRAELVKREADLVAERKKIENLQKFGQMYGFAPQVQVGGTPSNPQSAAISLRHITTEGISSGDCFKEFANIFDQATSVVIHSKQWGAVEQKDIRHSDAWFKEHFRKMIPALDDFARKAGIIRGKEAVTSRADIAPLFLEVLSAFVRTNHDPQHIWHNFIDTKFDLGKRNGETIDVIRFARSASRRNRSDWDLSNVPTLSTGAQAIQAGAELITVREKGMGKPGLPGDINAPIGVNTFLDAISVMDILSVVNQNLGYNYREFETAEILDGLYSTTPLRYYNKKGTIVTSPAAVVAGDDGTCTYKFIKAVAAQMASDNVPSYSNGKYVLVLGPQELATLESSLDVFKYAFNKATMAEMTRIFDQSSGVGDLNYDGYKGDIGDFMVFSTSTLYQGPNAALAEVVGSGTARPIRVGYAFGGHAVARGVAKPFNVRLSTNTDFDRQQIFVWNSYEGFGSLDIHESLSRTGQVVRQQNRVVELRFATAPV